MNCNGRARPTIAGTRGISGTVVDGSHVAQNIWRPQHRRRDEQTCRIEARSLEPSSKVWPHDSHYHPRACWVTPVNWSAQWNELQVWKQYSLQSWTMSHGHSTFQQSLDCWNAGGHGDAMDKPAERLVMTPATSMVQVTVQEAAMGWITERWSEMPASITVTSIRSVVATASRVLPQKLVASVSESCNPYDASSAKSRSCSMLVTWPIEANIVVACHMQWWSLCCSVLHNGWQIVEEVLLDRLRIQAVDDDHDRTVARLGDPHMAGSAKVGRLSIGINLSRASESKKRKNPTVIDSYVWPQARTLVVVMSLRDT